MKPAKQFDVQLDVSKSTATVKPQRHISKHTPSKKYAVLDWFRIFAALLIVAIHTSPLSSIGGTADFVFTRIIARVAVPFFFMATGYFLFAHVEKGDKNYIMGFCKKIGIIYVVAIGLYLPLNIYAGYFGKANLVMNIIKDVFIDGTFYHLWYLPATILGVAIVWMCVSAKKPLVDNTCDKNKTISKRIFGALAITSLLYIIGIFGDSYYGMIAQIQVLESFYSVIFKVSEYTRNGLLFAPVFIMLGLYLAYKSEYSKLASCATKSISTAAHSRELAHGTQTKKSIVGLAISFTLLLVEGLLLHDYNIQRHDSMYFMLLPVMYYLFQLLLMTNGKGNKSLRKMSLIVYIIHPWLIVLVRGGAKITGTQEIFIENSIINYIFVAALSMLLAWLLVIVWDRNKRVKPIQEDSRAWLEIDVDALHHNAMELQNRLPHSCKLMAVVKANAYGHGDVTVARELNAIGIEAFAVATIAEGVRLRNNKIKGEILILGYTNPCEIYNLIKYDLTQTIVDYNYAKILNEYEKKIKVHIKIDTGMHRLGEYCYNFKNLEGIFTMKYLKVEGVFTHLCASDSLAPEDVKYSQLQINRFYKAIDHLKLKGYETGDLHIQSSYGILNYPKLTCDYARAGIALYGMLSKDDRTLTNVNLKPVLSLKARVAMIHHISEGDSVGYCRQYIADRNMTIAVVAAGYADGIPRDLKDGYVLIHGQKAPIIGIICMDQIIVDITNITNSNNIINATNIINLKNITDSANIANITNITNITKLHNDMNPVKPNDMNPVKPNDMNPAKPNDMNPVKPNDVVTIIGKDGNQQISCVELAQKCATNTNEILSRLGNRLGYQAI